MAIARTQERRFRIPFKQGTSRRRQAVLGKWRRAAKRLGFFAAPEPEPLPPSRELTLENLLKHTEEHPQLPLLHPGSKFWKWGQYATRDLMGLYSLSLRKSAPEGEWGLPPLQAV